MANQIQSVMYEGYLGFEPEARFLQNGTAVTNFRMASNYSYKNSKGEEVKEVTWIRVTTWGKLAEIVNQYCGKGSHVIIEGRLRPDENGNPNVFDKKDGTTGASFEVTADKVRILKGKDRVEESAPVEVDSTDDAPF